jgi:N-acyl-D-amino-acid deacylase
MKIYKTILMALALIGTLTIHAQDYDIVLKGGRVMDPETSLDAIMNVGIKDGKIAVMTKEEISGKEIIDVTGLVVSPGFIDTHQHSLEIVDGRLAAQGWHHHSNGVRVWPQSCGRGL